MEVAALVLEYLKVFLGFSVTVPLTILLFCLLFRARIGEALGALLEVTFPGGSAKFERSRVEQQEMVKYVADIKRTAGATTQSALNQVPPNEAKAIQGMVSFFSLAARLLPLTPKAERRRFVNEALYDVPTEFEAFREGLLKLAEEAPEPQALTARDVITFGEHVNVELSQPPTVTSAGP